MTTLSAVKATAEVGSLEKVLIIGIGEESRHLPGSGAVVGEAQLEQEVVADINQVLKTVPGVYIREEDGAGLRPNIGIRGATAERSEKITLLEDGVLVAPAPYSNPAAYYFPTTMRMSAIEILKGAPLLRHGPQTTGGIVNLISTPIPDDKGGELAVVLNERGSTDVHANYGMREGQWSWLLETVQREGEGFKDIDRSNRDAGFDIEDYVFKLGWQGNGQSLLLKTQYSKEVSDETYLGLTDTDFDADSNRRYGLSSIDQMDNDHRGVSLTHNMDWSNTVTSTTTVYRNTFNRDWFKLSGGSALINAANNGDANAIGILDGSIDKAGLNYKHNNRSYESQGIQFNLDMEAGAHLISAGVRLHEDEMDRFQPTDIYDQVNGSLVYQSTTQPTGSNNRLEEADATSLWLLDDWQASEKLNINLALRYEDVITRRVQYADAGRNVISNTRSNDTSEILPGASFTYDINPVWQILAGVHRGFSPLGGGATKNEDPETSTNWEAGMRYQRNELFAEAIGFYSDFSDKSENCSLGSPCSNGATSGSFTTGEAEIFGIEFQLGNAYTAGSFSIPVNLAYTYTKAEISKDNAVSGFNAGDRLKDVPEHVASLRLGLEHSSGWDNYAVAKYISATCVVAGCNNASDAFDETESLFVVDLISHYPLAKDVNVFVKAENVFDEQKIVSRSPDGARPNKPFTMSVGMKYSF
ncbi:TonB-dependent receptor family protein [Sulfuriflexus sp.]|uniref:TonB-dependent receptor family protein n=1 Tax=Sulfuriflexus sp. TaxID=2015443 RepID=UPI0028CF1932|nr:TonB-dependent receptor [Sulfuriflexus sp.]MDT8404558.1 TonB-dependent receptor [Sulfuriflexus sp.]